MAQIIEEAKWVADFIISEAEGSRSRDVVTIPQGDALVLPGTLLDASGAPAGAAAEAAAILVGQADNNPLDPRAGPVRAVAIARDAEVNDAYLVYGEMARDAVNQALAEHGIIVREGVLPQSIVTPPYAPGPGPSEPAE